MPGPELRSPTEATGDRWREYDQLVELYKFYLNLLLSGVGAFYLVTGAIATFTLANEAKDDRVAWAVVFPLLMSAMFALAMSQALPKARELHHRIGELGQQLGVGLTPQVDMLLWLVRGVGVLMIVTMAGLGLMFVVLLLG